MHRLWVPTLSVSRLCATVTGADPPRGHGTRRVAVAPMVDTRQGRRIINRIVRKSLVRLLGMLAFYTDTYPIFTTLT